MPDRQRMALAGVHQCGCITAALVLDSPPGYPNASQAERIRFYRDMAKSDRDVRTVPIDELKADPLWMPEKCPHGLARA